MADPKHRKLLRQAQVALAAARTALAQATGAARDQARVILALRAAAEAVQATGLDARMAGELALSAEHRSSVLRSALAGQPEEALYKVLLGSAQQAQAQAQTHKALPFFARFLEEHGPSARGVATQKYPSDADDYITLKYPSDRDDTRESAAAPMMVTLKYPSDGDEQALTGAVPGRPDLDDDDPTEVLDRGPVLERAPTRRGPFDEDDGTVGRAEVDEAIKQLEARLP